MLCHEPKVDTFHWFTESRDTTKKKEILTNTYEKYINLRLHTLWEENTLTWWERDKQLDGMVHTSRRTQAHTDTYEERESEREMRHLNAYVFTNTTIGPICLSIGSRGEIARLTALTLKSMATTNAHLPSVAAATTLMFDNNRAEDECKYRLIRPIGSRQTLPWRKSHWSALINFHDVCYFLCPCRNESWIQKFYFHRIIWRMLIAVIQRLHTHTRAPFHQ